MRARMMGRRAGCNLGAAAPHISRFSREATTTSRHPRAPVITPEKPPLREKLCYGFGDLASVLYWQTFMVYLTFFYTDVFGIAAPPRRDDDRA